MKRRFQLCEHARHQIGGSIRIHARLKALRGDCWSVVGVFQLDEAEWQALAELCSEHGIPVIHDVEEPAIQA